MGVFTFVCRSSGGEWSAKQLSGDLEASAASTFDLQRRLVQEALAVDSTGGVQSSFSMVSPSSAVFQGEVRPLSKRGNVGRGLRKLERAKYVEDALYVIIGGGGGGGAFIGAGAPGGAAAGSGGSAAAPDAPPAAEEKKEEKEESDDDMGFSLFD
ncbi:60S acidic ribosomal protein [Musa troglodytarum]|uniref:60S acidic ribosomal protein n=1 Tax=Musa troglodytarum TaxID=320322 RepID=A0A9E7L6L6_9LILI|nr:60S acidic ribosomal protein [Musa troglodytarum]